MHWQVSTTWLPPAKLEDLGFRNPAKVPYWLPERLKEFEEDELEQVVADFATLLTKLEKEHECRITPVGHPPSWVEIHFSIVDEEEEIRRYRAIRAAIEEYIGRARDSYKQELARRFTRWLELEVYTMLNTCVRFLGLKVQIETMEEEQ